MKNINGLDLCSGIGGLALGLSNALSDSYRTVCWVERDPVCQRILLRRMQTGDLHDAPIWDDLTTFNGDHWRGRIHIISAGFPCQPFSTASRGRRVATDLWPSVLRVVGEVRPPLVVLENVPGAPWKRVSSDLGRIGFSSSSIRVGAGDVGAPHKRSRVFLAAYSDENSQSMGTVNAEASVLSDLAGLVREGSGCLGVGDGTPSRMDRLQRLGNAVVPQVVEALFR